jgi:prolyl oligopeptidase
MCSVMSRPLSPVESVTEILHGVPVTDPYRWLEDQDAAGTRAWIEDQTSYARAYLDGIPKRDVIRQRIRELVDVEAHDSFLGRGTCYFFRKRLPGQEQPGIYVRERAEGQDELLVDPGQRGTGKYTAVKPLRVSPDSNLLLYEVKQGGERKGTFEILDVRNRRALPDSLPHGYLRGFAFTPDGKGFYYVHEASGMKRPLHHVAYHHVFGTTFEQDQEIFCAGDDPKVMLAIVAGSQQLALLVYRFSDRTRSDFYLWRMGSAEQPTPVFRDASFIFAPRFLAGRILALTDRDAPNRKIVEVQLRNNQDPLFFTLVPEREAAIRSWLLTQSHIVVSYARGAESQIEILDSFGKRQAQIPCEPGETVRVVAGDATHDEVLIERETFSRSIEVQRYCASSGACIPWAQRKVPFDPSPYVHVQVSFPSKDGTCVPMFLLGKREDLGRGLRPVIMTSYGGYGVPVTPQFSVFVAFLVERGCLFALPNIRGGSEFGVDWHNAAKRRNRQTAFDDFLCAAEWLIQSGYTSSKQLAIFGGSNSGLLVGAALTQRPDLFRAVVCMVPLLDMLRYHLFDGAHVWKDEFGTAEDQRDFAALWQYSPYHRVRDGVAYPATMIISGDADMNCNPLHARKMTARLQAANASSNPIVLDYSAFRGHSPVLPLSTRIDALTDRMAFLCEQLQLSV